MVQTLCKVCSEPQGITHAVSAFWTTAKQDGALPDLIAIRTTVLDVYSVLRHGSEEQQAVHRPSHTLQLEASHTLHGEVRAMVCLSSRRAGHRDSVVLTFDAGQVAVLGWDTRRLAPVTTSLHSFSPTQLPTRGRTLFPCPPVARMEPSGRAVAILLYQSIIAVLPAVSPGVKQSVMTPHATATVGNSFVIDLTQHGIRSARDFTFLRDADAVCLVLCDSAHTWAGSLHERKDTCELRALSVRSQRKQQPVLWTAKRLPSDCFAVVAAPGGGAVVLSPSLIVYQNKSARLCLCTNTTVIPGVVPEDPNFDLYDDPQQKQQLAVELADKYAANVPPVTVPEAAGRAQQSEVQADLAQSTLAFLTPTCAVVALASGQLLQLALMSEGSGRVCKLALRDPGSAVATPVAIAVLSSRLLFFASWLGHSNLVSYEFQEPEADPERSQPAVDGTAASPEHSAQPKAAPKDEEPHSPRVGEAQPVVVLVEQPPDVVMQAESGDGAESIEQAAAVAAAVSNAGLSAQEPANDGAQEAGGLGALLEQMQEDPAAAESGSPETEPLSPAIEPLSDPPAGVPGLAHSSAAAQAHEATLKRPLESAGSSLRRSTEASTPLLKHARSASVASTVPGSGVLPGLPFAGLAPSGPAPATGGAIPGLGAVATSRRDEAAQEPVAEDDAMLQDDHDDLEEALYHPPVQDVHAASGHGDKDLVALHAEDRLPQLGPIASFALGAAAEVGRQKGTDEPILRGGHQLLACAGYGRSGAVAIVRDAVVPLQNAASDLTGSGLCTGVWTLQHGPEADVPLPEHEYMFVSFEACTYVYKFEHGKPPVCVSDAASTQFAKSCSTVFACAVLGALGMVQVCADVVNLFAGVDLVWSWTLTNDAQPPVRDASVLAATQAGAYLLLRLSTGGAVLLGETEDGGGLEEVAGSGAVLRPEGETQELGACCLFEDASHWLREHSMGIDGDAGAPARPAVYLLRCRHHSTLQVLELPSFRVVASFGALEQGDAIVRDRLASGEPPGPPPRVPEAFQVVEVRMDAWPALASASQPLGPVPSPHALHARRPLLLVRTRDERLYVYRLQQCAADTGAAMADAELCLLRQPLDWTRRLAPSTAGPAGGNPHCTLVPFKGVGVQHSSGGGGGGGDAAPFALYQGVFVTGHQPMWLLAHRGTYRVHIMDSREASAGSAVPAAVPIAGMAAWNRRDPATKDTAQAHSFVVATGVANACELRFCRMPSNLRLTMVSPTLYKGLAIFDKAKSRTEGVTPHAATYHAPSRLFFVSTSRRSIFMPHLPPPEDVAEDAHAAFAYRLAEAVARAHKGEPRFQLRGLSPDGLAAECEHKFKPLEHVLCLDTVKLNVPATAEAPPRVEVFVAAGVGTLVTEDWSSQGSVSLFRVVREEVLGFSGAKLSRWALVEAHRREFTGPVTAVSTCSGNLVVAFGHNVEMYKWTGAGLKLVSSPLSGVSRLVSCVSIIKNQYMLVGSARKGLAFVQVREAKGTLSLLSRDFGRADAVAVEFLLDGQTLAFLQADSAGNLAVFRYFPKASSTSYEPPGLRAVPVGRYHLAHRVTAVQRVRLQSAARVSYGALASASSGALVWLQPVSLEHHKALDALATAMLMMVPHVAGLNPKTFRSLRVQGHVDAGDRVYGAPPQRDVLDGELLWGFVGQSRAAQEQLVRSAGAGTVEGVVGMLREAHSAAAFY